MESPKGNPPMEPLPLDTAPVPVEAVLRPDPDAPLVARAQAGEMEAFEKLVDRHGRRVYRRYRGCVMLRDLEQLNTEEAATALGLNVATLKTRLLRGRLMLREALAPHFRQTTGGRPVPKGREGGRD